MKPFTPILTPEQRLQIARAPATTSSRSLARALNVSRWTVDYWRSPERRERVATARRARLDFHKFLQSSKDPGKRGRKKKVKLNKYEQMIHDAIGQGIGADELERKIDENLSSLLREKWAIEEKMRECKEAQAALFAYLDVKPVVLDDSGAVSEVLQVVEYMTCREMKTLMGECGLTMKALAQLMAGRYSERAIRSYREGQVPVPRQLAEMLKGYPKKQKLDAWG